MGAAAEDNLALSLLKFLGEGAAVFAEEEGLGYAAGCLLNLLGVDQEGPGVDR